MLLNNLERACVLDAVDCHPVTAATTVSSDVPSSRARLTRLVLTPAAPSDQRRSKTFRVRRSLQA
ncbi:MAG TPA: hypothetical protein VMH81_24980 [Bryobacteraceae bacterium]|nr:hypothetical protein [Bryobacteraceae bacterium]